LTSGLSVSSWFTPTDQENDNLNDADFGSGGSALVLNLSTGPQHLVIGGGKDGELYLLNGDSMGGSGDPNAWQHFSLGHAIFSTAAFWNNTLYIAPAGASILALLVATTCRLKACSSLPCCVNLPSGSRKAQPIRSHARLPPKPRS